MKLWRTKLGYINKDDMKVQGDWLVTHPEYVVFGEGGLTINRGLQEGKVKVVKDMAAGANAFIADVKYTPVLQGDMGGLCLYTADNETVELLEMEDTELANLEEIKVLKNGDTFDFFMKREGEFIYISSAKHNFDKIGFLVKAGNADYEPLIVNELLETTGDSVKVLNLPQGYSVELDNVKITAENEGDEPIFKLDDLLLTGTMYIYDELDNIVTSMDNTFYGGDVITLGTYLQLKLSDDVLIEGPEGCTTVGRLTGDELVTKLELHNPSQLTANDIIIKVKSNYGSTNAESWSDIAAEVNGEPGEYKKELELTELKSEESYYFYLRNKRNEGSVDNNKLCVNIEITHD